MNECVYVCVFFYTFYICECNPTVIRILIFMALSKYIYIMFPYLSFLWKIAKLNIRVQSLVNNRPGESHDHFNPKA